MQVPDQPAVWADFVHIRTVRGRKVCEIIFETQLEDLPEVLKRLGNPVGADSIPVAIVPIDPKAVSDALDVKPAPQASEAGGSTKPSRKWEELPYSQQAAIRCGEPAFQAFVGASDDESAAGRVRFLCGVASRSELDTTGPKSNWRELERRYQEYLTTRQYEGARHG